MIRNGEYKDIDDIYNLIKEFFDESINEYKILLDYETVVFSIKNHIDNMICIVYEKDNKIIGVIGGVISQSIFDKRQIFGQESMWFVSKNYRNDRVGIELIKAFEKECISLGANVIIMISMNNLNSNILDKIYNRMNYKLLERHYIKGV